MTRSTGEQTQSTNKLDNVKQRENITSGVGWINILKR